MGIAGLVVMSSACASSEPDPNPPVVSDVTYQGELRAVVEQHCLECHVQGGIAPFTLDSFEALRDAAPSVIAAVEAGTMPPWLPDESCRTYQDERRLPSEAVPMFREWFESGAVEGDVADYEPPQAEAVRTLEEILGEPTVRLRAREAYRPSTERPDDYRCFVLDSTFETETFLVASDVLPDRKELVHHVILFLVDEQFVSTVASLDAADPDEGYTCFGGIGAGNPTPIAGWAPGSAIPNVSSDAMIRIPAGLAARDADALQHCSPAHPQPDHTEIALWLTEERPERTPGAECSSLTSASTSRPARPSSEQSPHLHQPERRSRGPSSRRRPHMHLLGRRFTTTKVAADGEESSA